MQGKRRCSLHLAGRATEVATVGGKCGVVCAAAVREVRYSTVLVSVVKVVASNLATCAHLWI